MITDFGVLKRDSLVEVARAALRGGADVIQLRDKTGSDEALIEIGKKLRRVTEEAGASLIVNDRAGVAKAIDADGLHLGQEDGALVEAKKILGEERVYGRSTHSKAQAAAAVKEGFNYIGVGPVFATPTKPGTAPIGLELVRFAAKNISIPFVAIGGINESTVREVVSAGARRVAVVRAVMAADDPQRAANRLLEALP